MRQFLDANGLQITLETVSARNAYSGMLEGSPWMARKWRLMQGQRAVKTRGAYVHGLAALEQEIATLQHNTDIWAPAEEWTARFVGCEDWSRKVELTLEVVY